MNLRVVARKKYALRFSMGPLHFSLETREDSVNLPEFLEKNVEVLWTVKGAKQTPPLQPLRHNLAFKMNHIFAFDILICATWPKQTKIHNLFCCGLLHFLFYLSH